EESWTEAVRILQSVLDNSEDSFVEDEATTPEGKKTTKWVSVRSRANRMVGTMPQVGLEQYELEWGPTAATTLQEAREKKAPEKIAEVAQRFLHTNAGAEALQLLARHHLDAGNVALAARSYGQLLERQPAARWKPEMLFQATRLFRLTGDKRRAEKTWM